MSTDQNSTRDRSRDQVRISGGPGAPEPSVGYDEKRVDDLGGAEPHAGAPTDPGTDGTHTASESDSLASTEPGTHATHTTESDPLTSTEPGTHQTHTESDSLAATEPGTHGSHPADTDGTPGFAADPADDTDRAHGRSHSALATDDAATADGLSGKPTITADPTVSGGESAHDHDADHEPHDVEPHSATVSREPGVPATIATAPEPTDIDKPFFDNDLLDVLNTRWKEVQGSFVDNPHDAVTRADLLVSETVEQITTRWSEHQQQLQGRWSRGTDSDTENLRQALRDYRDFFQKLLTLGN
ncbi:hypothetical protein [Nocardia harenae]|uniref:hypothetical protein n=1 Tax=Nocardia harenae TaxID=358707 RepID=UPI00082A2EB7|nr:hypothetical protein [Nocardia harenae]